MKQRIKNIIFSLAIFLPFLSSVEKEASSHAKILRAQSEENVTLSIYNWEDYMAMDDNPEIDIPSLFHDYMLEKGKNVTIQYSTFDTNETMLSQLKIGSVNYDLICPSDYVIQKMIKALPFTMRASLLSSKIRSLQLR